MDGKARVLVLTMLSEMYVSHLSFPFTDDVRPNILAAMKEIHDVSCVRFKDKEAADKHWIQFVRKNGYVLINLLTLIW